MEHKNLNTKHSVFTAPDVLMHTSLSYTCTSNRTAYKAIEHLINSY